MLNFQRKNLVESSSSAGESDSKNDPMKMMESKNPLVRLAIFGKIKRMINSFTNSKLNTFDKRLLRGLYLRNLNDFDEDFNQIAANHSLLARLRGSFHSLHINTSPEVLNEEDSDRVSFSEAFNQEDL